MLLWAEEETTGPYLSWNLRTYSTHEYVTFFLDFIYFCFLCVLFYCIFIFIFLSFLFFLIQMALRNNFYFRRIVTKYSEIWAFRDNAAEIEIVPKSHLYQDKNKGEKDENKDTIK